MKLRVSSVRFVFLFFVSAVGTSAHAETLATCHATKITDDWIFEDALDLEENSSIRLDTTPNGFRFFVGKATYENWEYCNIEAMQTGIPSQNNAALGRSSVRRNVY